MDSLKALVTQIKTQIDDADFAFTDKTNLISEVLDKLIDLQKKHGTQVYLEFAYKRISFSNPTTKQVYEIINQNLTPDEKRAYIKSVEVETQLKTLKNMV